MVAVEGGLQVMRITSAFLPIDENDDARRPWTMTGIILTIMKDYDKDKLEPGYHVS